jgi:hypothetical protein
VSVEAAPPRATSSDTVFPVVETITVAATFLASFTLGAIACWAILWALFRVSIRDTSETAAPASPRREPVNEVPKVELPSETPVCSEPHVDSAPPAAD